MEEERGEHNEENYGFETEVGEEKNENEEEQVEERGESDRR